MICILYTLHLWCLHHILLCIAQQIDTCLSRYLISFWCCCQTLWQCHVMFCNLKITQLSNNQLNFENQWIHCHYLQALLLILKDLHSFSPMFIPAQFWQSFSQACLFIVFLLAKIGKVFKLSLIWCTGQDWEPQTVLLLAILVHE